MDSIKRNKLVVIGGWILIIMSCLYQKSYAQNGSTFLVYNSTIKEGEIVQQEATQADIQRVALHLYRKAMDKYKESLYWKSALDLIVLLDFYPEFSKMDGVIYHLGNCLYEMDMLEGADRLYRYLLRAIPKTPFLPEALLGLQKIYYKKKNYQQSLRFYKALEAHYSNDDLIHESRYYAGQSYYHLSNYVLVPEIMAHIHRDSKFYAFGLYTSGLAYLKKKVL